MGIGLCLYVYNSTGEKKEISPENEYRYAHSQKKHVLFDKDEIGNLIPRESRKRGVRERERQRENDKDTAMGRKSIHCPCSVRMPVQVV